ncbi:unnamed protein product, partial [Mesorhabditis belari]|uniref:Uncharacterized protein n=1 Tax=Mesorhabditis belari TaxID=2138241 RepID=A0AAF3ELQ1_9BILA
MQIVTLSLIFIWTIAVYGVKLKATPATPPKQISKIVSGDPKVKPTTKSPVISKVVGSIGEKKPVGSVSKKVYDQTSPPRSSNLLVKRPAIVGNPKKEKAAKVFMGQITQAEKIVLSTAVPIVFLHPKEGTIVTKMPKNLATIVETIKRNQTLTDEEKWKEIKECARRHGFEEILKKYTKHDNLPNRTVIEG